MKLIDTTCPKCGANLRIDADRQSAFCEYCGAQILIDDEVQHFQIDNAENAGYAFEKGRQRAQHEVYASRTVPAQPAPQKKKKIFWWVLGWIFIFPIPLTIIIARNKKLKPFIKAGIIIAAWVLYLLIGIASGAVNKNKDQSATPSPQTSYSVQAGTNKIYHPPFC